MIIGIEIMSTVFHPHLLTIKYLSTIGTESWVFFGVFPLIPQFLLSFVY